MIIENMTHPGIAPTNGDVLRYTYANGTVEKKKHIEIAITEPDSAPPELFVDIDITDPDHLIPGVANDGINTVAMAITLRTADENILKINDKFRIILRDGDGNIYSILKILFVDGVARFNFKTTRPSTKIHITEGDLSIPGMDFTFHVRGDNELVIFEDFSS